MNKKVVIAIVVVVLVLVGLYLWWSGRQVETVVPEEAAVEQLVPEVAVPELPALPANEEIVEEEAE